MYIGNLLLIMAAVVSIVMPLVFLLTRREINHSQMILSLTMVICGFAMVMFAKRNVAAQHELFVYCYIFHLASVVCIPMFYMGICALTQPRRMTMRQRWVMMFPLLYIAVLTLLVLLVGANGYNQICQQRDVVCAATEMETATLLLYIWTHYVYAMLMVVGGTIILFLALTKLRVFARRYNSFYAVRYGAKRLSMGAVKLLVALYLPMSGAMLLTFHFWPQGLNSAIMLLSVVSICIAVYVMTFIYSAKHDAKALADNLK